MVLRLVLEWVCHLDAFHTIATSDGIANKLYLSFWQSWSLNKFATLVEHKSLEFRVTEQSLYHIHHLYLMDTLWQCRSHGDHRVSFGVESYFERFVSIHLCHEISCHRTANHLQRSTLESSLNGCAREVEASYVRVLGKAHTPHVLNHRIGSLHHIALDRERCGRLSIASHYRHTSKH